MASRFGSGRCSSPDRGRDLIHIRHRIAFLFGYDVPIHEHGQLTAVSVHDLHIDARLLPQSGRQTGGVLPDTTSDGTLSNGDALHFVTSFRNSSVQSR